MIIGYNSLLDIQLTQQFHIDFDIANHLKQTYGGRAIDVLSIELTNHKNLSYSNTTRLVEGYPYVVAEVLFAVRCDWACSIEDIVARRTRLAFVNKEKTIQSIPFIAQILANELKWSEDILEKEIKRTLMFLESFGGSIPLEPPQHIRIATMQDMKEAFDKVNLSGSGYLTESEVKLFGELLHYHLSEEEIIDCFLFATEDRLISLDKLANWWTSDRLNPHLHSFHATNKNIIGSGILFS